LETVDNWVSKDWPLGGELSFFRVAKPLAGEGAFGEPVGIGVRVFPRILLELLDGASRTVNRMWRGWLTSGRGAI